MENFALYAGLFLALALALWAYWRIIESIYPDCYVKGDPTKYQPWK